ncbi:hypothetical protein [Streptomyces sp. IBSNAI001]
MTVTAAAAELWPVSLARARPSQGRSYGQDRAMHFGWARSGCGV